MENNTDQTSNTTEQKVEISFFNRPSTRAAVLVLVIVVGYFSYSYMSKRSECLGLISYHPATQSVESDNAFIAKQGQDEYYSYPGTGRYAKKFKSQSEALNACLHN